MIKAKVCGCEHEINAEVILAMKGDTGNGIAEVLLNSDYTLTIKFTDGTEYTTISIRGEAGKDGEDGKPNPEQAAELERLSGIIALLKDVAFSASYNDLTDKPELFSGDYFDLIGKPDMSEYVKRRYYENEASPVLTFAHNYWTGGEIHLRDANLDEIADENGDFARFEMHIPAGSYSVRMNQTPADYSGARCSLTFYDANGQTLTRCNVLKRNEVMGLDAIHGIFTIPRDAYYVGVSQTANWSYIEEINITDAWIVENSDVVDGKIVYAKINDAIALKDWVESRGYLTEHQSLTEYAKKSELPTNTNQLINGSGYITKAVTDLENYYTKTQVNGMVSAIPKFAIEVVDTLPTSDISTTTVYLVKESDDAQNLYTEYIYVGSAWEKLGVQDVDLTGYATEAYVDDIVEDLRLFKFPNATIVGEPLIENGNISRFSVSDYLVFPFVVDVRNRPFVITMCFTTGADVTTQQNILDSYFGMALAIQNGRGIMALSSNGTNWDIGLVTGVIPLEPNKTYYAKISWDGTAYRTALSQDGIAYTDDMYAATTSGLYPTTMYIGASPNIFGAGSAHPFGGTINLNKCHLSVAGLEVWQGMDDAGLSTRADLSLSNLDAEGERRFSERYTKNEADGKFALKTDIPTVPTNVGDFTNDAGYLTVDTLPRWDGESR